MVWHISFSLQHCRFIGQHRAQSNRKLRRKMVHWKPHEWNIGLKWHFFTLIQYTMLQYASCNGLLLCAAGGMVVLPRERESIAAVLLGWLLLSRRLVPVSEINDNLATLLSTWYLRDRDTGDALQTLYTINPVCVCLLSGEQCVCVGGCRCKCLHMSWHDNMQICPYSVYTLARKHSVYKYDHPLQSGNIYST